jgi:hypothetical protein
MRTLPAEAARYLVTALRNRSFSIDADFLMSVVTSIRGETLLALMRFNRCCDTIVTQTRRMNEREIAVSEVSLPRPASSVFSAPSTPP